MDGWNQMKWSEVNRNEMKQNGHEWMDDWMDKPQRYKQSERTPTPNATTQPTTEAATLGLPSFWNSPWYQMARSQRYASQRQPRPRGASYHGHRPDIQSTPPWRLQQISLRQFWFNIKASRQPPCQRHLPAVFRKRPYLQQDTRESLLPQRHGWVAFDEMAFYVPMAANSYPGMFMPPQVVLDNTALCNKHYVLCSTLLKAKPMQPLFRSCIKIIGSPLQPCHMKTSTPRGYLGPTKVWSLQRLRTQLEFMTSRCLQVVFRTDFLLIAVFKQYDGSCPWHAWITTWMQSQKTKHGTSAKCSTSTL